jgi:ClpP class serine protease
MENKTSFLRTLGNVFRTLFWLLLIVLLLFQWLGSSSFENKRVAFIETMQKEHEARAITLIHRQETVSLFGIPVSTYIDIDDAEAVLRAIRLTPPEKTIDLILHKPSGLRISWKARSSYFWL